MKKTYEDFLESIKAQLSSDYASYSRFMVEETYLAGKRFSFEGHEYQDYCTTLVEQNPGKYFYIKKCSQIGLSEWANRLFLARAKVRPGSAAVISFPTKTFAQEVMKTRITSVIDDSPALSKLINGNVDSASVKAFYNGSIIYALGGNVSKGSSNNTLLNRPLDGVLVDERDRQDNKVITGYRSRMTHTAPEDRLVVTISTPTVAGIGIDADIDECSEVHTPHVLHTTCGHAFVADFYEDVVLPGFDQPLLNLTRLTAATLDLEETYLRCPGCGEPIEDEHRDTKWVVTYNEEGTKKKIGVCLDPFVAKSFISMPDLIESMLEYSSHIEWLNQGLGKTADKSDSSLEAAAVIIQKGSGEGGRHIYGLDLGKLCHYLRGVLSPAGTVHVEDTRIIRLSELEEFLEEEAKQRVFTCGVVDSQPYSELVYRLIKKYPRLYSAIYVSPNPPIPELYRLKLADKHDEMVRQVSINKNLAMDSFAGSLKDFYTFEPNPMDATMTSHFLDMRRVRDYRFEEMVYKWVKSAKGEDHFWHTAIYLFMAGKLAMTGMADTFSLPVVLKAINPERKRRERERRR